MQQLGATLRQTLLLTLIAQDNINLNKLGVRLINAQFYKPKQTNMNRLKTPQEKANERYKAESIKPLYAFIIVCVAFLITAILQNI